MGDNIIDARKLMCERASNAGSRTFCCARHSSASRSIQESDTMTRQLSILTLVIVVIGGAQSGHAQPRSSPPTSQAGLDEASRLNKLAEKLYSEGQLGKAVPL